VDGVGDAIGDGGDGVGALDCGDVVVVPVGVDDWEEELLGIL